jgi:Ca2+-binding RTX toxin-like protein
MKTIIVDGQFIVASDDVLHFRDQSAFLVVGGDPAQVVNHGSVLVMAGDIKVVGLEVQAPNGASFINDVGASFTVTAEGRADGFDSRTAGHSSFTNAGLFAVSSETQGLGVIGGHLDFANQGDITVTGVSAATGVVISNRGSFDNEGSIEVSSQGFATGVQLDTFLISFVNDGAIHVAGGAEALALWAKESPLVLNTGSIVVEASAEGGATALRLEVPEGDPLAPKLINSGLIQGDIAIQELGNSAHGFTTVIRNDGHIVGQVILGNNPDRLTNNGEINGSVNLGEGDDQLLGERGHISGAVDGGIGDDLLLLGKGADTVGGSFGADTLSGGKGADVLTGGDGKDLFRFLHLNEIKAGHGDLITDLHGSDIIDLSIIDADTTQGGDQAFVLVAELDGHAGQATLSYDAEADVTHLLLDVDGDGQADGQVDLQGAHQGFTNFVL